MNISTIKSGALLGLAVLAAAACENTAPPERVAERSIKYDMMVQRASEARRAMMASVSSEPGALRAMAQSAERTMRAQFPNQAEFERVAHGMLSYYEKRAAMDSTTSGSGSELVATLEARSLWMDVNLHTQIAHLIPTIPMPSNPFDVPTQMGDVNFYPGAQNTASTTTALNTGKATLNAYELVGQTAYSYTLE